MKRNSTVPDHLVIRVVDVLMIDNEAVIGPDSKTKIETAMVVTETKTKTVKILHRNYLETRQCLETSHNFITKMTIVNFRENADAGTTKLRSVSASWIATTTAC